MSEDGSFKPAYLKLKQKHTHKKNQLVELNELLQAQKRELIETRDNLD
jgi:hypothetical protein